MSENIALLISLYGFIGFIAFFYEFLYSVKNDDFVTPIYIYENSEMNWFGCWFFFILLSIFSPFMFIMKILIYCWVHIYNFLDWLFHVGRKDDE